MPHNLERATLPTTELRVATDDNGQRTISGLIPYNSRSVDLGGFTELLAPGCFADAVKPESDVLALRDHNSTFLLGRTKSGTLKLFDGADGLRYTINLPNTTVANDLAESISRGDLDATSFGFAVNEDKWTATADEVLRTLVSVNLLEVSPCSFPAYPASSVSIRTAPKEIQERIKPLLERSADDPDSSQDQDEDTPCTCQCGPCLDGDCAACSDADCDCEGCNCTPSDPAVNEASERNRMHMALAIRSRK